LSRQKVNEIRYAEQCSEERLGALSDNLVFPVEVTFSVICIEKTEVLLIASWYIMATQVSSSNEAFFDSS